MMEYQNKVSRINMLEIQWFQDKEKYKVPN